MPIHIPFFNSKELQESSKERKFLVLDLFFLASCFCFEISVKLKLIWFHFLFLHFLGNQTEANSTHIFTSSTKK